ncbi:Purine permease 3 [Linum perenne]
MDMEANMTWSEKKEGSGMSKSMKKTLLLVNCVILSLGSAIGPLVLRLYFVKGATGVWIPAGLETAGWPIIIFPLIASYIYRRGRNGPKMTRVSFITWRLALASAVLGILTGLDDFLYASGVNYLPVSTSALVIASQLAFTACFAFLLVRQSFTAFSVNAIVLLCMGSGVLALNTSSDRPPHVTSAQYFKGFFMTVGAAVLYGFVLPAVEFTYKKADQSITYTLVLEMQMVISFFATSFNVVGMIIHKEIQVWQCFFLGAVGVVSCGSSLLSGVLIATFLPITEILAVFIYNEQFGPQKAVALVLSLWGFVSYFYGEYKQMKDSSPILG